MKTPCRSRGGQAHCRGQGGRNAAMQGSWQRVTRKGSILCSGAGLGTLLGALGEQQAEFQG